MREITVQISDERAKAIEAHIKGIQEWLQHAIDDKGRRCEERILKHLTDKQPEKLTKVDRVKLLKSFKVEPYSEERQKKPIEERIDDYNTTSIS